MASYDFSAAFATSFSQLGGTQDDQTLLDLLKLFLGIDPGDTTNDEALTRALNMAGDMVETYLDRIVVKRETAEFFPHHFGTVILHDLPFDPTAPIVVTLDGVNQVDYKVFRSRGQLAHLSRIGQSRDSPMDWRPYEQVIVTYTAGFDPIPSDLAQAIVYVAADLYASEGTGATPGGSSGAVKSMTIQDVGSIAYDVGGSSSAGGGAYGSPGVISDVSAQMIARYKRMMV